MRNWNPDRSTREAVPRKSDCRTIEIVNLVVRHLNLYVGKERIHCFSVVRPVARHLNAVIIVVRGNRDPK